MDIEFFPITPAAASYPRPFLPVQPVLGLSDIRLFPGADEAVSAFMDAGVFLSNARTCLASALALSGVGPQTAVLMPAFHCVSMVEPALWLGAELVFYPMKADLSPDAGEVQSLLRRCARPVRAMVLPHYFGFPQAIATWRKFCDEHRISLIEDCAHSFFGSNAQGAPLGSVGDYAVASVRKFFSSPNGGILVGRQLPAGFGATFSSPGPKAELKATVLAALEAANAGKLGFWGPLLLGLENWRMRKRKRSAAAEAPQPQQQQQQRQQQPLQAQARWHWFDPAAMQVKGLGISRWLMRHCQVRQSIARRRRNYLRLLAGIRHTAAVRPLFPVLPEGVVPYMFPLVLQTGEQDFDRLKAAGVPIWRWEDLAVSPCPVSRHYRLALLQIPCHQSLTTGEIDRILHQLTRVLGDSSL